ncbi:MAG: tRNA pseudouridine(55) synthase TruB [Acidaminococcaceae bacterium]|nr:tRNA pseudouridine(55) synthase TruB [Acidaminococcaceae bacterium]
MTDGIINVFKPPGLTSHDVVNRIRRIYGTRKAGHSGTLDPDAAGVLPVFIGNATRLLEYAATDRKRYRAEGLLGIRTETGDVSGKVLERKPVPDISAEAFAACLTGFLGTIMQVPPMYSAIKVKGKKLYEYARQGIAVERVARPVEIFKLELVSFRLPRFTLDVDCSKGTYIRTLLEDIGASLGTCATLERLVRTRAGKFSAEDAHTLEEIADRPEQILLPMETAIAEMQTLQVNELQAFRITSGVQTTLKGTLPGRYSLWYREQFLGVVKVEDEIVKPEKILFPIARPKDPAEGQ